MTEEEQLQEIESYKKLGLSPLRLSNKYLMEAFSPRVHSEVFISYCEVVIWPDGKIEYAIPSHCEKLYLEYCKKYNINRDELWERFKDDPLSASDIMMKDLGIVFVWYDHMEYVTKLTDKQLQAIQDLVRWKCVAFCLFDKLKLY